MNDEDFDRRLDEFSVPFELLRFLKAASLALLLILFAVIFCVCPVSY